MRRTLCCTSLIAVLMLVLGWSLTAVKAEPVATTNPSVGTITGTVVDKDQKPVPSVKVNLMAAPAADKAAPRAAGDKAKAGAARGQTVIKTVTTDADGKFTMADVPAGDYMVMARSPELGAGRAKVTVAAGDTATITLTLKARPAK